MILQVPKSGIFASTDMGPNIRSDWTNFSGANKDCYLIFNSGPRNENCAYSRGLTNSRDTFDTYYADKAERVYEGVNVQNSNGVCQAENSPDCIDSWFLLNCVGCRNCFGCVNLRHKSYHFFNEPLNKEEWNRRVEDILGTLADAGKSFERVLQTLPAIDRDLKSLEYKTPDTKPKTPATPEAEETSY